MTHAAKQDLEVMQNRIDALVGGELTEEERRVLLAWLEAEVSRWRQCGLAFLEAQLWQETLQEGAAFGIQGSEIESQWPSPRSAMKPRTKRSWIAPLVVLAASLAAFVCGLVVHDWWQGTAISARPVADAPRSENVVPHQGESFVASVPVNSGPLGDVSAALQIPVRPVDSLRVPAASSVPDHIRKLWERRGYQLVEERRYLPARLPDGRQVMVPVNEVKMRFVGKPVS